jgi:integrase
MGLGPVHAFSLVEARNRARRARQLLADGIDPLEARRAERAAAALAAAKTATFKTCAAGYYDAVSDRWKNAKHRSQFLSTMETYVYPVIGSLAVADIDVGLVLKVLQPIWKSKLETASRIRGRIEAVLNWATVRGYRTGDNPARWKGFLSTQLSARTEKKHFSALPYTELPAFMAALRNKEGIPTRALEFVILTAARTGAAVGARWDEIDFNTKTWTVPAARAGTKISGREARRVPLSDAAIVLLQSLPRDRDNPHIFPGLKPGSGLHVDSMLKVLARLGRRDITVHGFRSVFKTWVSETTNYPNHVSEAALWHSVALTYVGRAERINAPALSLAARDQSANAYDFM